MWEYRYRNHAEPGSPMRQITLSVLEYPTETKARIRLQEEVLRINGPESFRAHVKPTMGVVIEKFKTEEHFEEILDSTPGAEISPDGMSYSTVAGYSSYLTKHVEPRWSSVFLTDIRPLQVSEWLKKLPLSPKTKGHVRALFHMLFERAMLWGLLDLQRNPIELIKLKGTSRRLARPYTITPEKFQELIAILEEPYRTMVTFAICTGLRVSEVLALRWEHIDFAAGVILVQQGVVSGRIGKVKTEASQDEIPIDPAFASVLLARLGAKEQRGLVFPSHVTGRSYHAGILQQKILRPKGEEIGIPKLGWHTFRHTYRSLLDEAGAPIGVQQKLMRHSNVATTMNVYGNSTLRAKQDANSKVVKMLIREDVA
ncbi:MAG TPA: site-specific integrase [Bryobacteraceae bacterium]|nr:site-specific integrase [Bryobacteraceae bacterium]